MEMQGSPWSKGALFICEKCGRRDDGAGIKNFADDTKSEFKSRLKDGGQGKDARVMISGCLSLCPDGAQVAAWCPQNGAMELIVFDPAHEKEAVWNWLQKKL